MIGNLSFEEHVRHFNDMYNHLKSKYQHLDVETIVETIRSKVMIVQEWENITHNLNIKDIHDTAMVKDFEKWTKQFYSHSNIEDDNDVDNDDDDNVDDDDDDESYDDEYAAGNLIGLENYLRNGGEGLSPQDEGEYSKAVGYNEEDDDDEDDEEEEDEEEDEGGDLNNYASAFTLLNRMNFSQRSSPPEIPDDY